MIRQMISVDMGQSMMMILHDDIGTRVSSLQLDGRATETIEVWPLSMTLSGIVSNEPMNSAH